MQPLYINIQTITVSQSLTYSYDNYLEWVGLNNPTHQFSPKQTYFFYKAESEINSNSSELTSRKKFVQLL